MMKNVKNLILVRHADYKGGAGDDPGLSDVGKDQSLSLAISIRKLLGQTDAVIWSSPALRAAETAQIIKQELSFASLVLEEKLWSDNKHHQDFKWLLDKLQSFEGENLIIVSHLEYVRYFPEMLNFSGNNANYAQGVLIRNGKCELFN